MSDLLRDMIAKRRTGNSCGISSYCTANALVIEAILQQAKRFDNSVLIEATANQVNQFGGYTGMQPANFRDFIYDIAAQLQFPRERILLGGDHLGPLTWADEVEQAAMGKAEELVKLFVEAGFKKIHLDTSMKLADDPKDIPLSNVVIAERGARLYQVCEQAFQEQKKKNPLEQRPVYIIGSEVPIPGGACEEEKAVTVTKPEAVEQTIAVYRQQFKRYGMQDALENVIGIVVQPGVEFADDEVFRYDHERACALCRKVATYDGLVMEGHSTDYQTQADLRQMVKDGIAILKVGPALTFALRKGLFALDRIEKEVISEEHRANFEETLEKVMLEQPGRWKNYYRGTQAEITLKRKYSLSDRCRYYFALPEVQRAIDRLLENIDRVDIPLGLLYQYMPAQYARVRSGTLEKRSKALLLDCVVEVVEIYDFAQNGK